MGMSPWRRFAGAGVAGIALVVTLGIRHQLASPEVAPVSDIPEALFSFEKEDLVGITIERPSDTLTFERSGAVWTAPGQDWRPSASMMRRVAHQLHDLTARARVAEGEEDLDRFGLGESAVIVHLELSDGAPVSFAAGDPNPSSVSWYLRPLPGGAVYVVKKAAIDYFRAEAEAFREDRLTFFEAAAAERLTVSDSARTLSFERVDDTHWRMLAPRDWPASRDAIRRILGALSAARSQGFVADAPEELSPWGLDEGALQVAVGLRDGQTVTLRLGRGVADADPPQRYAWMAEDDVVYQVRAALADPLELPLEGYRDPRLVDARATDLTGFTVVRSGASLVVSRSADAWRWPDGGEVPGATPQRVASAAADPRATAFFDEEPREVGFGETQVELAFGDRRVVLELGAAAPSVDDREQVYARVQGMAPVVSIDARLVGAIDDLFREHRRRVERAAERTASQSVPGH